MRSICSVVLVKSDVGASVPTLASYIRYHTFGYYDYAFLKRIDIKNQQDEMVDDPRLLMKETNGKYSFHHMRLYFDSDNQSAIAAYQQFWEKDNPVFAISFLHRISDGRKENMKEQQLRIEQQISERLHDTPDFHFVRMRSAALSDCVVLWKTNSIQDILLSLEEIYRISEIGYTWSVCGIDISKSAEEMTNTRLSHVSIRLIQRDAQRNQQYLTEIDTLLNSVGCQNTIIGSENLIVLYRDVEQRRLIPLLKRIQNNSEIGNSIYSIDTQIGCEEESENRWSKDKAKNESEQKYLRLLSDFEEIYDPITSSKYPWLHTVYDLINQSIRMSKSFVTDEICCITFDSLELFVHLLKLILRNDYSFNPCMVDDEDNISISVQTAETITCITDKEAGIQKFIRGYQLFLEQIVKIDGPIFKEPGYHPILFDVPAKIVNYYTCFCRKVIDICTALQDSKVQRNTAFLIVPKLCRQIKVVNILRVEEPCDTLLIIDLPYSEMYHTQKVMVELAHEIMHFTGDAFREREYRKAIFIDMWVMEIDSLLDIPVDNPNRSKVMAAIQKELNESVYNNMVHSTRPIRSEIWNYMNYVSEALLKAVMRFFKNKSIGELCLGSLLNDDAKFADIEASPKLHHVWDNYVICNTYDGCTTLQRIHNEMRALINDCFSDWAVCMLMDNVYDQYIRYLFERYDLSKLNNSNKWVYALMRAAVITIAIKNEFNLKSFDKLGELKKSNNASISIIVDYIQIFSGTYHAQDRKSLVEHFCKTHKIDLKDLYPFEIVVMLVRYLQTCNHKALGISIDDKIELKKIWEDSVVLCSDSFLSHLTV